MVQRFAKGSRVAWNWGNGRPEATVVDHSTGRVERTIKGTTQSRNGTEDNPAYVLEQSDGRTVLKLHSELEKA